MSNDQTAKRITTKMRVLDEIRRQINSWELDVELMSIEIRNTVSKIEGGKELLEQLKEVKEDE